MPYIKGTTDRIGHILRRYEISTTYKPHQTIETSLKNPKQKIKLENHGVYSVKCGTCYKTYVGQTNRRISARLEEHKLAIKNKQTTSALFQHQHQTGHKINFDSCKQIASAENYKTRLIREAIEIEKIGHLNKRDDALHLSSTWKAIIKRQSEVQHPPATIQVTKVEVTEARAEGAEPTPTNQNRYNLRRRTTNTERKRTATQSTTR